MPLYEYKCSVCEQVREVLQKFDDPAPECTCTEEPKPMEKVLSLGNFSLKGPGWFSDGYTGKK